MNKAILVLEMPQRCLDCLLGNSDECEEDEVYCNILNCVTYQNGIYEDEEEEKLYNHEKPDYCPLRPLPEKKDVSANWESSYDAGWNDCINVIEKREET